MVFLLQHQRVAVPQNTLYCIPDEQIHLLVSRDSGLIAVLREDYIEGCLKTVKAYTTYHY